MSDLTSVPQARKPGIVREFVNLEKSGNLRYDLEFFMTCRVVCDLLSDRLSLCLFAAVVPPECHMWGTTPRIFLLALLAVIFVPLILKIMALPLL